MLEFSGRTLKTRQAADPWQASGVASGEVDCREPCWTDLIPELNRQPKDHVVAKHTPGAFTKTNLEAHLRSLEVTQVVDRRRRH
jgi:nicotinamidase-related amidase